eukprot:SAG22_NODE_3066_length_1969_cov_1.256684_3_plen_152_part_01
MFVGNTFSRVVLPPSLLADPPICLNEDLCCLPCLPADILVNFRLAYYDERGIRMSDPKIVARTYVYSGWFALDVVAGFPIQHVLDAVEEDNKQAGTGDTRLLKIIRLVRLARMLRVAKIKRMLDKYQNSYVIQQYFSYVILFVMIIFTAHFL